MDTCSVAILSVAAIVVGAMLVGIGILNALLYQGLKRDIAAYKARVRPGA